MKITSGRTDVWDQGGIICPCCAEELAVRVTAPTNKYVPCELHIVPFEYRHILKPPEGTKMYREDNKPVRGNT